MVVNRWWKTGAGIRYQFSICFMVQSVWWARSQRSKKIWNKWIAIRCCFLHHFPDFQLVYLWGLLYISSDWNLCSSGPRRPNQLGLGAEKRRDGRVRRPKSGRGVTRDVLGMFDEFWDRSSWDIKHIWECSSTSKWFLYHYSCRRYIPTFEGYHKK